MRIYSEDTIFRRVYHASYRESWRERQTMTAQDRADDTRAAVRK